MTQKYDSVESMCRDIIGGDFADELHERLIHRRVISALQVAGCIRNTTVDIVAEFDSELTIGHIADILSGMNCEATITISGGVCTCSVGTIPQNQ